LGAGVIYLRILPSTRNAEHNELVRLPELYSKEDLVTASVLVEPAWQGFRKLAYLTNSGEMQRLHSLNFTQGFQERAPLGGIAKRI